MLNWSLPIICNSIDGDIKERWKVNRTSRMKKYKVTVYNCANKDKHNCPAIQKIESFYETTEFRIYFAFEHSESCISGGISPKIGDIIIDTYLTKTKKPYQIQKFIEDMGIPVPIKVVYSYIGSYKKKAGLTNKKKVGLTTRKKVCQSATAQRAEPIDQ
ncbi:hypothetical protein AYI70_g1507 [Smittium culicis]|uniref:Uncharacterized protein n=1 Tax=Smittium culicis TaxID=133412 RepID=A0A1R1YCD6_9FUNG|nr:hypothetical protein AYI70_g1507 [Smittium culicis]